jgi:hypothetical protein
MAPLKFVFLEQLFSLTPTLSRNNLHNIFLFLWAGEGWGEGKAKQGNLTKV